MSGAPTAADGVVVGGGILGLATARELLIRRPGSSVVLLEAEPDVGRHQTSHNSGVIHAGIYYAPGSLKARLSVAGAKLMYAFCEEAGVDAPRCGKVVVASDASELERLDELERRCAANGVEARRLTAEQIREIEPHAVGVAGLHSPNTGIVDFLQVAKAMRADVEARGGTVISGCAARCVTEAARGAVVTHAQGRTEGKLVIACAGLGSDRLAQASGGDPEPRIVPIRGAYYRLRRPELCRTLIYPVPDPRLPFLGVHLTRRVGGDVVLGPTALLVGARDAYALTRVRRRDLGDTLRWPGTYKFIRRWWRHAAEELTYAVSREAYAKAVRRLVPEVRAEDLEPSFAGIRAQALDREGKLLDDFAFTSSEHTLHVRNAPSPAATSSLAIAAHLADHVGWAAA